MANSMYVPLAVMPNSLQELRGILARACDEFGVTLGDVKFAGRPDGNEGLLNDFVLLEGGDGAQCWISFNRCVTELSGREGYGYIANVQTRVAWDFAGIVAYGLCLFSGYVVFNDAGELGGSEEYTAETLRQILHGRKK
ncbi:hypothetical protein [Burkholderia anthina]|uniref:hypothetical protein n=1 Tax=Burkholderia anthina TaxID=179879 RepID=UPI0012DA43F0|nr:hypothetical protein [Burkholderia anthina]